MNFYSLALFLLLSISTGAQENTTAPTPTKKVPEESKAIALEASKDYDRGDFAAAEKEYQQALSLAPYDSDYLNHLAAVETHLNKLEEAEHLLRSSIQQKLENPFAWLLLGTTYLQEKRTDEAFAALIQATLYDPKNARAQHYLGIAAGRKKWSEISEASLRKAIELDPNYGDAHFNLAVYYMQHNPPATEVARRHYQRALELGVPHDPTMDAIMKKPVEDLK
ncbi:MAG: tetratricopeptide repeat protein [Chthoniobacterales bacterium]